MIVRVKPGRPMSRRAPLPPRRRGIRRRLDDAARDAAAERAAEWAATKQLAWTAWGYRCAVGRDLLTLEACHGHHRLMRSAGGPDTLLNCLPVCGPCHERIHRGGDTSYDNGWLVRAWLRPDDVPILAAPPRGPYPRL